MDKKDTKKFGIEANATFANKKDAYTYVSSYFDLINKEFPDSNFNGSRVQEETNSRQMGSGMFSHCVSEKTGNYKASLEFYVEVSDYKKFVVFCSENDLFFWSCF